MSVMLRSLVALGSLGIAAFSVFGFLASFEPGVSPAWKVGYAVVFCLAILAATFSWSSGARK